MQDRASMASDIKKLLVNKQMIKKASAQQKVQILDGEKVMMQKVSRMERRGSELNTRELPISNKLVPWTEFTSDMESSDKGYKEVKQLIE